MVGREAVSGSASVVAAMLSSLDFKKQQEGYVQDPIQETTSVQNPVLLLCMVPHHLAKDWLKTVALVRLLFCCCQESAQGDGYDGSHCLYSSSFHCEFSTSLQRCLVQGSEG